MDVGLIGCGRVAGLHMCAYKHIPETNVVAVSDINLEKAKAFAQKYRINKTFKDYSELLEMKNLDLVSICTPTSTHAEIACDAAELGQNILLEKPMARSTKECDKMIAEVSKHKVKLSILHNQLFLPQVMRLKDRVDSGEFDPAYFRVSVKESAKLIGAPEWIIAPEQGGILWETGTHCAYLQLHFLKDVDEVSAVGGRTKHSVYDHFFVLLHTKSQALGVIELSWLAPKKTEIVFELLSSDGKQMKILDYDYPLEMPERRARSLLEGFYSDQKAIAGKWIKSVFTNLRHRHVISCLPHYIFISRYIYSIEHDLAPPVKPEDGRKTINLLECIEESLVKNQPIKVTN